MKFNNLFDWLKSDPETKIYKQTKFRENFFILNWDTLEKVELFLTKVKNWKHITIVHENNLQALPFSYLSQCAGNEKPYSINKEAVFKKEYALQVFGLMLKHGLDINDYLTEDDTDDDAHPNLMSLGEFLISHDFSEEFLNKFFHLMIKENLQEVEHYLQQNEKTSYSSLNGQDSNFNHKQLKNFFAIFKEQYELKQFPTLNPNFYPPKIL